MPSKDSSHLELVPSPTPAQRRFLDLAAEVVAEDAAGRGELAFLVRILVQATLPYRDLGDCTFVRKNGSYTLTLQAPPHIGLPYGRYPRLVLAYLCREAVRTRSREIRLGDSLSDFMRAVGVHASGGPNGPLRRFRKQAARLLATTISCSWTGTLAGAAGQAEMGARIASRSVVWWGSCRAEQPPGVLDGGWLVLSQDSYEEILAHPVPLDRRVLRTLTSSFALDLYAWTTYRVSRLQRPVAIPWDELARQFGSQERALRNFRLRVRQGLERIRVFYPGIGSKPRGMGYGSFRARATSGVRWCTRRDSGIAGPGRSRCRKSYSTRSNIQTRPLESSETTEPPAFAQPNQVTSETARKRVNSSAEDISHTAGSRRRKR